MNILPQGAVDDQSNWKKNRLPEKIQQAARVL
jgi:hypothetical protein